MSKPVLELFNSSGNLVGTYTSPITKFDVTKLRDFVAELRGTQDVSGSNLTVSVEDSFDGGTNWNTWISFNVLTATGSQVIDAQQMSGARLPGGDVRAKVVVGTGAGSWTVRVKLACNVMP